MSACIPLTALLRREFVVQLRRVRPFLLFMALALITVWFVAAAWPAQGSIVWAMLPPIASGLLAGISAYLMGAAALFVPGVAATAIVTEREQRTWDLLALTQLRPLALVTGKALSAVGVFTLFVIGLFPITACLYFLIGLNLSQFMVSLGLIVLTSLTCAVAGVASSAWTRRSSRAIGLSYAAMLTIMGLPTSLVCGLLNAISLSITQRLVPGTTEVMMLSSPAAMLVAYTSGGFIAGKTAWAALAIHAGYQSLLCGIFFSLALVGIRRRASTVALPRGVTPPIPREKRSLRAAWRALRYRRRKPRPPIPDRRNPAAVREIWWGPAGSLANLLIYSAILLFCSLSLRFMAIQFREVEGFAQASLLLFGAIICIAVAGNAAGVFTRENEQGGVDMLRMTLLTPADIVRGKFWAVVRFAILLGAIAPVLNIAHFSAAAGLTMQDQLSFGGVKRLPILLLTGHGTILVSAVFSAAVAAAASVVAKKTSTAVVLGYGLILFAFFGAPLLVQSVYHTIVPQGFGRELESLVGISSPVIGYVMFMQPFTSSPAVDRQFLWLINLLEFLVLAALAYLFAVWFYTRRRAQDK